LENPHSAVGRATHSSAGRASQSGAVIEGGGSDDRPALTLWAARL